MDGEGRREMGKEIGGGGCGCDEENAFKEEDKRKLKLIIELW